MAATATCRVGQMGRVRASHALRAVTSVAAVEFTSAVAPACRTLRAASAEPSLWREKLLADHATVLQRVFGGTLVRPLPGQGWRAHYFSFASTWMSRAREYHRCRAHAPI